MRPLLPVPLLAILSLVPALAAQEAGAAAGLPGSWGGGLIAGAQELHPIFRIEVDPSGGFTGTVDDDVQKLVGMPLSRVECSAAGAVVFEFALTGGMFEGAFAADGTRIAGTWKQRGAELPLELARVADLPPVPAETATALSGIWQGKLVIGAIELRVALHLSERAHGGLGGTFDSLDQGAMGIPVSRVDAAGEGRVRIAIGSLGALFEAGLDEEGRLAGGFRQGGLLIPLALERVEAVAAVPRPQTPQPPFPYRAEEVNYRNEAAGVSLAGTLTLPPGDRRFPAALLITGSGPQDRDEAIFQHRPFLVIADHLTRAGVAVLRVDDRGIGGSTVGAEPATSLAFAGDVAAGVAFLRARAEIDPARIGLIGHSEGGVIAPLVAAEDSRIAFLVLLAGTGEVGAKIIHDQSELIGRASGGDEETLARNRALQERLFALALDSSLDDEEAGRRLAEALRESPDFEPGEDSESAIAPQIAALNSRWMRFFLAHDPAPVLERVKCSVLALNGTLDLQVPCESNLAAIGAALDRGGNEDHEEVALPGLNHMFQHSATGLPSEYGSIEETFAPEVLAKMSEWILARAGD